MTGLEKPTRMPPRPTVRLEGEAAARYRQAARTLGVQLEGDAFDVDRAGASAELTRALAGGARGVPRGAIIWILCSATQAQALHGSERYSFEEVLLDRLYEEAAAFLERVLATDALIAIVTVTPALATRLEELGMMESVHVELRTASGSLEKLTELLAMNRDLDRAESYLSRSYLQRMVELSVELSGAFGSVSELSLPSLDAKIGAFCAPALGSVYYFDGEPQDLLVYPPPYKKPELEQTYQGLALPVKLSSPNLTRKLQEMGLLRFDTGLIPLRLEEIENENLLSAAIDPTALGPAERNPAVSARREALPRVWHELGGLAPLARRQEPLPEARLGQLSEEARVKLAVPVREIPIVSRLLSDLDHIDYPRFYRYNRARFATHFVDYPEVKKRYVWNRISRAPAAQAAPLRPFPARDDDDDDIRFIEQ